MNKLQELEGLMLQRVHLIEAGSEPQRHQVEFDKLVLELVKELQKRLAG
jgi:hypothetical protein